MKRFAAPVLAVLIFAASILALPSESSALSCLTFEDSVKYHLEKGSATVFIGKPIEQRDFASTNAQLVEVSSVLSGAIAAKEWVYFNFDKDWGYGCNSKPSALKSTWSYVVLQNGPESRNVVAYRQAVDSAEHKFIVAEIEKAKKAGTIGDGVRIESSSEERTINLQARLKSMIEEILIVLEEFKYWSKQK